MREKSYETVIISDLHMGSDLSRAGDALDFLRSIHFRRLILLGDMFADLNFSRLTKEHWKFLSYIRKLSNPKHDIEVVWVEGNHDLGLTEVMSHLVGIRVYQQYEWTYAGKKHLAIHGHQFDSFAIKNFRITHFGQLVFLWLQKFDSGNKRIARYLDRLNTRWLRLSAQVAQGALSHGKQAGAERIFCGHTHVPLSNGRDGVEYYNSGAWVDLRCTYITVDQEGVSIREYVPGEIDDRNSGEERVEAASDSAGIAMQTGLLAPVLH